MVLPRRIEGVIIPTAPVIHGAPNASAAGKNDNHSPGRRIPILLQREKDDNTIENLGYHSVNVISGNGIRGLGRRIFIAYTLEVLGIEQEELPKETVYLLFVGGATGSGYKLDKIAANTIMDVREKLPFINLLGGTINGHFISSVLSVDFAKPYLRETAWENTSPFKLENPPSYNDFEAQIVSNDISYAKHEPVVTWEGKQDEVLVVNEEDVKEEGKKDRVKMLYTAEAIPAGTHLMHGFTGNPLNEDTKDTMDAFISLFISNGYVGGWSRAGHGSFKARYYDMLTKEKYEPTIENYTKYLEANKKDIVEMLKKLPSLFPIKANEENGNKKAQNGKRRKQK
jgi:hypothetical protein